MKITINNNEHGLQWGMGAIEIFCDTLECDIPELFEKISDPGINGNKAVTVLLLAGLQNYAELHDEPFMVSYRQVQAWIDETGDLAKVLADFSNSNYLGKTVASYFMPATEAEIAPVVKKKSRSVSL